MLLNKQEDFAVLGRSILAVAYSLLADLQLELTYR